MANERLRGDVYQHKHEYHYPRKELTAQEKETFKLRHEMVTVKKALIGMDTALLAGLVTSFSMAASANHGLSWDDETEDHQFYHEVLAFTQPDIRSEDDSEIYVFITSEGFKGVIFHGQDDERLTSFKSILQSRDRVGGYYAPALIIESSYKNSDGDRPFEGLRFEAEDILDLDTPETVIRACKNSKKVVLDQLKAEGKQIDIETPMMRNQIEIGKKLLLSLLET